VLAPQGLLRSGGAQRSPVRKSPQRIDEQRLRPTLAPVPSLRKTPELLFRRVYRQLEEVRREAADQVPLMFARGAARLRETEQQRVGLRRVARVEADPADQIERLLEVAQPAASSSEMPWSSSSVRASRSLSTSSGRGSQLVSLRPAGGVGAPPWHDPRGVAAGGLAGDDV
jgi:hypothetical protein